MSLELTSPSRFAEVLSDAAMSEDLYSQSFTNLAKQVEIFASQMIHPLAAKANYQIVTDPKVRAGALIAMSFIQPTNPMDKTSLAIQSGHSLFDDPAIEVQLAAALVVVQRLEDNNSIPGLTLSAKNQLNKLKIRLANSPQEIKDLRSQALATHGERIPQLSQLI